MMYQMVMGFAIGVFMLLVGLGMEFGAPFWYFLAAVPVSPVLSLGILSLFAHIDAYFEGRARAKRRAASTERRSQGL